MALRDIRDRAAGSDTQHRAVKMSARADRDTNAAENYATTIDEVARFESALMKLPRFTCEVFLAHRLEDLSYSEIASRTGVTEQRVEREIAHAICGLARALDSRPSGRGWWKAW